MLFFKECKKAAVSFVFIIIIIGTFAMYITQYVNDTNEKIEKPLQWTQDYGMKVSEDPDIMMPAAINKLTDEYISGEYIAYPIGFYKKVRLSDKEKKQMTDMLCELTGLSENEIAKLRTNSNDYQMIPSDGGYMASVPDESENNVPVSDKLTYKRFREIMKNADKLIGGGTDYSDENILERFSLVPKTYDDALDEYNTFLNNDKVSRAYARLYCDYMGIDLSILPVFISTAFCLKDKKYRMQSLIYSRKISSLKLVSVRFAAIISVMIVPVIITAVMATDMTIKQYGASDIDIMAFIKYSLVWLVPSIMFSAAFGMFAAEKTSTSIGILIYCLYWFINIFSSSSSLTGYVGSFNVIVRHNSIYDSDIFKRNLDAFTVNRLLFTALSIILVALTVVVYEKKRRGDQNEFTVHFKNSEGKSKA